MRTLQGTSSSTTASGTAQGQGSPGFAGLGPFAVNIPVARLYEGEGFLCDSNNNLLDPYSNPLTLGMTARVCVKPNDYALSQGVKMRSIDSFTWSRTDTGFNLTQDAVNPDAQAASGTTVTCNPGDDICVFETDLGPEFFTKAGRVDGSGVIWLQFGTTSRRLDFTLGNALRSQMAPGFAGASPFTVFVYVVPPLNNRTLYHCRVYECDYLNREIVPMGSKEENVTVRMCVAPDAEAQQAGAMMWKVEWWTWERHNYTQKALVPQGQEAEDGLTLSICERGSNVCVFQTRLIPEFFDSIGIMDGTGYCWLTFGSGKVVDRINNANGSNSTAKIDPTKDPLFAGANNINYTIPVTGNWTKPVVICVHDNTFKGWWKQQPEKLKLAYILLCILPFVSTCCLGGLCLLKNRRRYEDEYEGEKIVVNVDIQDNNKTENISHHQLKDGLDIDNASQESACKRSKPNSKNSILGEPSEDDVCLGLPKHPGNRAIVKAVRKCLKENPDSSYTPPVYKAISKRLGDRHFFTRDSDSSKWRDASKKEIITSVGEIWKEQKKKMKG